MSAEALLLAALCAPLLCAVLVPACRRWPDLRDALPLLFSAASFAAVLALAPAVSRGARPAVELGIGLPELHLAFELEPLGLLFAAVAAGLWLPTSLYAVGYLRAHRESHQTRFFTCFALAIAAALGVAFSANLLTLFLFYELLTLSTYPLVTHRGTAEARRGGRVYLALLLGTSVTLFLYAVLWTDALAGTLDFRPGGILRGHVDATSARLLLGLFVFGIGKAALMPMHRWLPAAMVAPAPVSALLHAVAVVKAGVFAVLKIVLYVFGLDLLGELGAATWLLYVASATIVIASGIALTQDNLKARLAYSTVSQLAYIVLGAALATASGLLGGALHIATHAVAKITLFFCAGAIDVTAHKRAVSELDGIGRSMPFTMGAFALASLSIIGLPPLGGTWSKWYLAAGALESGHGFFVGVLLLGSLLSLGYLMPIVTRAFFAKPADGAPAALREAPLRCLIPLSVTALGSLALFFLAPAIWPLLRALPLTSAAPLASP